MAQKGGPCSIALLTTIFVGWVLLCLVVTKGLFPKYSLQMLSAIVGSQSEVLKTNGEENASQQMAASSQQRSRKELAGPAGADLAGRADSAATKPQAVVGEGGQETTVGPDAAVAQTSVKAESLMGPAEVAAVAKAAADGNAPAIGKEMVVPAEVAVGGNPPASNADVAANKDASTANADVAANSDASTTNADATAVGGDATASSAEVAAVVHDADDANEATTDVVQAAEVATVATTAESGSNEAPGAGEAATVVVEPAAAEAEVQAAPTEETVAVKEAATEAAPAVGGGDFGVRDGLVAGLPHNVCGMERPQLGEALAKPHGTAVGSKRYYFEGRWMTSKEFRSEVRQTADGAIVCVVVHVARQMPCKGGDCVLHFYLRAHDTDVDVLKQLVERQEMEGLDENANFKTILDGGGNCGIASVLFATQYPDARIVSVEPAVASFNILVANTKQFPNVVTIRAGLWNRVATLGLWGHEAWGMQVKEINPKKKNKGVRDILDGVSIPFLLHVTGLASFDFIKIDIEGSEKEVFEKNDKNDLSFMDGVRTALIEIHEHFREGAAAAVQKAFSQGFRESQTGEYKVYTREYR